MPRSPMRWSRPGTTNTLTTESGRAKSMPLWLPRCPIRRARPTRPSTPPRREPPPAYDSPEKAAELAEIKNFPRTPKTNSAAYFWEYAVGGLRSHQYWAGQTGRLVLEHRLDNDPPRAARAYALQTIAGIDASIA